jgi:DNA-binding transcriptional regulator YiaG
MPNIASILKAEISRVARKEVRGEIQSLKKATASYRSEIARLKRRTEALEKQVKRLGKGGGAARSQQDDEEQGPRLRFSAKGLASQRRRLGLSAEACGALVGATGQSVYKWESGKIRPRARHLPAIAALRKMGRREAAARLAELGR